MAETPTHVPKERPTTEKPTRKIEPKRVLTTIKEKYHAAQDRMRQALTLPDNYSFDLTEFNGKMDALKAKQHELDATTQAQLEQFAATNPKDMLDTSSVDKTKIREQLDEVEKVKKLRLQLGLPEVSPLLPTPESIAEKKRMVDEYLNEKLQKILDQPEDEWHYKTGFIDQSKRFLERVNGEKKPLTRTEKIKRAGAIKVLEMKGIPNAQEVIDFTQAYSLDIKSLQQISTTIQNISLAELQTGKDRMEALGYLQSAYDFLSQDFILTLKKLATVDAQTMQKVCDQLNPYTFLDKSPWTPTSKGKTTAELSTLTDIAVAGGLSPEQKQTLDTAQRIALLDTDGVILQKKDGTAGDASYNEKTIADVLERSFPTHVTQDLITLCEDNVVRVLQLPEEYKQKSYNPIVPETNIYDMIRTLNNRTAVPLHLAASLTQQGIDSRAVLTFNTDTEKTTKSLHEMQELMQNPIKREWTFLFAELSNIKDMNINYVDYFEKYYPHREILSQAAKVLYALPEEARIPFSDIIQSSAPDKPFTIWPVFNHMSNLSSGIGIPDRGLSDIDAKYINTVSSLINYWEKRTGQAEIMLPLATYLAEHKANINTLFQYDKPTQEMTNIMFNTDTFAENPQLLKAFIDKYYHEIDPVLLLPHLKQMDTNSRLSTFSRLPEDVIDNNPNIDANTKTLIQAVKNSKGLALKSIYVNHEGDINDLYRNGAPTEALFDKVLVGDLRDLSSFTADQLANNPNLSEKTKTFIQIVTNAPTDSLKKIIAENRADVDSLYKDGQPTEKLFDILLSKADIPTLDKLVGKNTLLDIGIDGNPNLSEKTKMYLNTINNMQTHSLKNILIQNRENFDEYFQDGQPTRALVTKVIETRDFYGLSSILTDNVLGQLEGNTGEVLRYWKELPPTFQTTMVDKIPNFPYVTEQDFVKYKKTFELAVLVNDSPSKEIQRLKTELIDQLLLADNPEQLFAKIESIFIKNNLPLVGKVYRVFETIYDKQLDTMIASSNTISPRLKEASHQERRRTIYDDLLGVNIDSGNPSLRKFLTILESGEELIQKADSEGVNSLSEPERRQFDYFLDKMDTIYSTSLLGRRASRNHPHDPSLHDQTPAERLQQIHTNFRVQEGQTITTRLAEMFVKPLGYESTHQVREVMQQAKTSATERNKQFANETMAENDGIVQVKAGDIFKGTDQMYIRNILENGSVAKEYLGPDSGSDMTPLDTDVSVILADDIQNGVRGALDVSPSKGYGNMVLIVRDRGQFNKDSNGRSYELFQTGVAGERHYGIRTGFASTEISAIMDNGLTDRQRDNMYFTIARNGFYIPVTDAEGKITFTPDMYDEYRKIFDGVSEYDGAPLVVDKLPKGDIAPEVIEKTTASIQALVSTIKEEAVTVDESLDKIRAVIKEVLTANGVKLRDQYDTSIFGADFADTGSTGRHTNKPGDMDFDLSLLLDAKDIARMPEIAKELKEKLNAREDKSHEEAANEYTQIRAIGAQLEGSEPLDIDIGIGRRADAGIFASHDAINAKLNFIRETYGEETYYEVLANVVLAKQVLKEGHAYKKLEDGGFGGIGTEDWILANHGNMLKAFKTFNDAAHDENGNVVSLEDFRTRYRIFNAGTNIKFQDNAENFVFTLKPEGYQNMVQAIESYLQAA